MAKTSAYTNAFLESISPTEVDVFRPLEYTPTPQQQIFHDLSKDRIWSILYGGAAGGGKTCACLMDAIHWAMNIPGIRIACIRRSHPELEESFLQELGRRAYCRPLGASWNQTMHILKFPNGSIIKFTYAANERDTTNFQGGQYQIMYIDEATLVDGVVIQRLEERLRTGDRGVPRIGIRLSANPGGPGHQYIKDRFVTPTKRGVDQVITLKNGRQLAFVPAKVSDNPYVGDYEETLKEIPDIQRRRMMLDGDWDAAVGAFFEQYSYSRHVIPLEYVFVPPKSWQRYCGIDWGWNSPWAALWAAQDNDGRLWLYRELYASQVDSTEQAKRILAAEAAAEETVSSRVADPAMWGHQGGTPMSIADVYGLEGCGIYQADTDHMNGYARLHNFLNDGGACEYHRQIKGLETCPMLHIMEGTCPKLCEEMPAFQRNPNNPDDGWKGKTPDHAIDALRYLVMSAGTYSRPILYDDPEYIPTPGRGPSGLIQVSQIADGFQSRSGLVNGKYAGDLSLPSTF